MHLSMFPSPSLGVEGDGDTQGLDQQKITSPGIRQNTSTQGRDLRYYRLKFWKKLCVNFKARPLEL